MVEKSVCVRWWGEHPLWQIAAANWTSRKGEANFPLGLPSEYRGGQLPGGQDDGWTSGQLGENKIGGQLPRGKEVALGAFTETIKKKPEKPGATWWYPLKTDWHSIPGPYLFYPKGPHQPTSRGDPNIPGFFWDTGDIQKKVKIFFSKKHLIKTHQLIWIGIWRKKPRLWVHSIQTTGPFPRMKLATHLEAFHVQVFSSGLS